MTPATPDPPVPATVAIAPPSAALHSIGDTVRMIATVSDQYGQAMAAVAVAWTSSDAAVATVTDGLVSAVGNGSATMTATTGLATASAEVAVEQLVAEVAVSPAAHMLVAIGDTVRFVAEAFDSNGHAVEEAEFDYRSSDETVATVSSEGLVTAVDDGNARVTATSGVVVGSAEVAVRAGYARDRAALVALYEAAGGPAWSRNDNWLTDAPLGEWYGVRIDSRDRVVGIDLLANGLDGHLPPALSGLERLEALHLGSGHGAGWVCARDFFPPGSTRSGSADEAGRTAARAWGRRDSNGWTCGIDNLMEDPQDPDPELAVRAGSQPNRLRGRIPSELGALANLQILNVGGNLLSGPLPPELGRLTALRKLLLGGNDLSGPLPPELGALTNLETLNVAVNDLSGPLPSELGALTSLEILDLTANHLSGPLPSELGGLAALRELRLQANDLSGELPAWLGNLGELTTLALANNEFTGLLPPELGHLTDLEELILTCNALTGAIPPELANLRNLRLLRLFGNQLSGEVPAWLGDLADLEVIALSNNWYLFGRIPPSLGQLTKLEYLSLGGNQLSGPIPAELGRLANLQGLSLFYNELSGSIPSELGGLTNLEYLGLFNNELSGSIPPSLGRLPNLRQMHVFRNRLTGSIPPELGSLPKLQKLWLDGNQLAGSVPLELGSLRSLRSLDLSSNPELVGPLPLELTHVPLDHFHWSSTGLCAPRLPAFRTWLAGLESNLGEGSCTLIPRETFAAFYDGTGGSGWANHANWLTQAPLSTWFGLTVEDSLVVALDLADNGLSGTLPSEIREFSDLRRIDLGRNALTGGLTAALGDLESLEVLDLSSNRFSGPVPSEISYLDALERLDLSDNELQGALPGELMELGALRFFDWSGSGACAPEATRFQRWLSSVSTRVGPTCRGLFTLSVPATPVTQAAQDLEGTVPLIAGRRAMLRVFATADRTNDHQPDARAAFFLGSREIHAVNMSLDTGQGIPDKLDPADVEQSYSAVVPGSVLRRGVEMVVEVDPDSIMPRRKLDDVRLALDVVETPPMELTIVPIVTGSGEDEAVLDWIRRADDPPVEFMRTVLPVAELDLTVREPYRVANPPVADDRDDWHSLLLDLDLVRTMEGGSGYWYGVVNRDGDSGVAGIAFVEGRVGLGIPDAEVFAHEVGHNMSLRHAPCGSPSNSDPDFPYADGTIGVHGYDPRSDEVVDPSTPDLMSYCHPRWISDYNFNKALQYRMDAEATASAIAAHDRPRGRRLLLWGGVGAEGQLRLDPAFWLDAPARTPSGSGPYRVEGLNRDGTSAFALDFDMAEGSYGGGGFLFLIPFEEEQLGSLGRIVLTGPEGSALLERDASTPPVSIVFDRESGRIRSILRGSAADNVAASAAAVPSGGTQRPTVLVSYGLPRPATR